ncbi:MAG: hypothetical protein WA118_10630 [Carboxydocellales bacterium]
MKKEIKSLLIAFIIIILLAIGFITYTYKHFRVDENFTSLPLNFNPYSSTSTYNWNGLQVSIQGGFIKGKIIDNKGKENLLLRSLSPTPRITVRNDKKVIVSDYIRLENINALKAVLGNTQFVQIIDPHTILIVATPSILL